MYGALLDRLRDIKRLDFERALLIGADDTGSLQAIKNVTSVEWREECAVGETEHFPYAPQSLDLIICCGDLHRVNDLPGTLVQMRRALKPDGLLLAALVGGETLHELRDTLIRVETRQRGGAAPRIHPMVDLLTMSGLMQRAGFALPVADVEIKVIYYKEIRRLLKDIKASGESLILHARSRDFLGRGFWQAVEDDYKNHHAEPDGLLRASIEVIYAIGWGPADTQQRPLKPGSAQTRLAEALGTTETKI